MTAAGVKSCFDGVSFAKEKVTEWQEVRNQILFFQGILAVVTWVK